MIEPPIQGSEVGEILDGTACAVPVEVEAEPEASSGTVADAECLRLKLPLISLTERISLTDRNDDLTVSHIITSFWEGDGSEVALEIEGDSVTVAT